MRIIYAGTPGFAVEPLRKMVEAGHEVVAVVTAPDRPAGRGRQLQASAVKLAAQEMGLPVFQPEKLRDPDFLEQVKRLQPDLGFVVAFRMLPQVYYSIPPLGTVNLHASLLPQYRGAAPINWALINGESKTGVTTFLINEQIDTGNILLQDSLMVPEAWNAGDLHDALMHLGAALSVQTIKGLEAGTLKPLPQQMQENLHTAPKLNRQNTSVRWEESAASVYHLIRGLNPAPGVHTLLDDGQTVQEVKIGSALLLDGEEPFGSPGSSRVHASGNIQVACGKGAVLVTSIQLQGRKKLPAEAFLRGYTWTEKHRFVAENK
jgi:methionyl-tRNA formyltransferase